MDWTTWRGASCLPDCWCEATRTGHTILEPVNTWTNLGFILVGLYFIVNSKNFALLKNIELPKFYGLAMMFVGAGSFFFHMSQTFVGQWFDVFGMYLVSVFYIVYNFYRVDKITFIIALPETRRWLFGVTIVIALIQSLLILKKHKPSINNKYLWSSVASYATAQAFWLLDKEKIWCSPYSWINGHGIWHIMTCVAAVLIYKYFQSERPSKTFLSAS
jgi:hypothetical protein